MHVPTTISTITGTPLSVQPRTGSREEVTVRPLPIRLLPQLLIATTAGDEARMVELYCDKPEGWADTLSVESHEKILEEGERLNADFFARWLERRKARQERLFPGQQEALLKLAVQIAAGNTASSTPSQTSPSDPG